MTYHALAIDYDGTIAYEGKVDDETVLALQQARAAGLRLILVTGRELADLFNTFADPELFDAIVAENGAVLYVPATGRTQIVGSPPPPAFLRVLQERQVPLSVGHSIVATVIPHEQQVLAAIRELGLKWHVIFNKEAVMALPSDITKATGLTAVLDMFQLDPQRTIGIGDGENDEAFFRLCGLAVAVDNAVPALKELADLTTAGARGQGVQELIARLLGSERDSIGTAKSGKNAADHGSNM